MATIGERITNFTAQEPCDYPFISNADDPENSHCDFLLFDLMDRGAAKTIRGDLLVFSIVAAPMIAITAGLRLNELYETIEYELQEKWYKRKHPKPTDPEDMPKAKLRVTTFKEFLANFYGISQLYMIIFSLVWICNTIYFEGVQNIMGLTLLRTTDGVGVACLLSVLILFTKNWVKVATASLRMSKHRSCAVELIAKGVTLLLWAVTLILPAVELLL